MTAASRKTLSERMRLPLALGVSALMVTGTTAMAWPMLKTAFVPIPTPTATADNPKAVTGFVDMTRAQMDAVPAVLDPVSIPAPMLAQAFVSEDASEPPRETARDTPAVIPAQTAQTQTMRPVPRPAPEPEVTQSAPRVGLTLNAAAPRAEVRAAPVTQQQPAAAPPQQNRLGNVWMLGAYR